MAPVPSGTERVHDQRGGSGQLGLRAGSAESIWVKMSCRRRVGRLKIATYKVGTLLRNRFQTLRELDDIDTMSENITDKIQQCASRVAKVFNKPRKSNISLLTRVLMSKRREMAGNDDNKQRTEYPKICKTIKKRKRGHQETP